MLVIAVAHVGRADRRRRARRRRDQRSRTSPPTAFSSRSSGSRPARSRSRSAPAPAADRSPTGVAAGVAIVGWLINGFAPLVGAIAWLKYLSLFYYYAGNDPLTRGVDIADLVVLGLAVR